MLIISIIYDSLWTFSRLISAKIVHFAVFRFYRRFNIMETEIRIVIADADEDFRYLLSETLDCEDDLWHGI